VCISIFPRNSYMSRIHHSPFHFCAKFNEEYKLWGSTTGGSSSWSTASEKWSWPRLGIRGAIPPTRTPSPFHPHFSFLFAGYLTTLSELNAQKARRLVKTIWVINCKGFERKRSWPIRGNIPVFLICLRGRERNAKLDSQVKAWKLSADLGKAH
jgi:hypothetical protein